MSNVLRGGGMLDTHVEHIGQHTLGWEKIHKKNIFFIEQVTIQIQNCLWHSKDIKGGPTYPQIQRAPLSPT